jgi:hypothetical protein
LLLDFSLPDHTFEPVRLPALQMLELEMNQIDRLLQFIVPGTEELGLYLAPWPEHQDCYAMTNLLPFLQRAQVALLSTKGHGPLPSEFYALLPHLRVLRFYNSYLDSSTFIGMQEAADILSKLHTIDVVGSARIPGEKPDLRAMRSLKSLAKIRFTLCDFLANGERPEELPRTVEVIESPELRFGDYTSPFD